MIREIIKESSFPFKQAWDLKLRRMYFYLTELGKNDEMDY